MALVLGAHYLFHDSCFTLTEDGEILGVYEVERFNHTKMGRAINPAALDALLADFNVTLDDLDYVGTTYHPAYWRLRHAQIRRQWGDNSLQAEQDIRLYDWMMKANQEAVKDLIEDRAPIIPVRHHAAHLAGVFYPSPFEEAAIMSVDGAGEAESTSLAFASGVDIDILTHNGYPDSLGFIYYLATEWLGWGTGEEGKTMALASYGSPKYLEMILSDFLDLREDGFFTQHSYPTFKAFLRNKIGPDRKSDEPLTQVHKDIAASVQALTNIIMLRLARTCRDITGADHLIITGGVALNSVANGKIMQERLFKSINAYPHANDTGVSIGAALHIERHHVGNKALRQKCHFRPAYLGRNINDTDLEEAAAKRGLSFERVADAPRWAAARLAEGKIVGFIQGRSELGPRALGNRSILANPFMPEIKDVINAKIKNREMWRPFAPSVLDEDTSVYFEADQSLPYMIIVADVRPEWRSKLEAVSHIDHTARVQSVAADVNPNFHHLLRCLKEQTGVGMVLNTSFNDRGEPIVNSVEQALALFTRSEMDCLVIGDAVFAGKPEVNGPRQHFSPFDYLAKELQARLTPNQSRLFVARHPDGMPLEAFDAFFKAAIDLGLTLVLDSDTIAAEEAQSMIARLKSAQAFATDDAGKAEKADVVLLGPAYGSFWLMREKMARDPIIDRALEEAAARGGKAFGLDANAGLADLGRVARVRDNTIQQVDHTR